MSRQLDCRKLLNRYECTCKCGAHFVSEVADVSHTCPLDLAPCRPGTALKSLLASFGLTAGPDCKCNQRARYLDEMGCDWAEANANQIVGWLRESAAERGLPFLDVAGRVLVRRAIANARRKEAALAEGSPHHDRREEVAPPSDAPQG